MKLAGREHRMQIMYVGTNAVATWGMIAYVAPDRHMGNYVCLSVILLLLRTFIYG
jgi:hypothetical protein